MTSGGASTPGYFLHVFEVESPWSKAVCDALAGAGVEVRTQPDVYAALATLLRRRGAPCLAIFVCLDWLDEREHAFFGLVARRVGPIPVWVYANRAPVAKLAQPLQAHRARLLQDEGQLDLILSQILPVKQPLVSGEADAEVASPLASDDGRAAASARTGAEPSASRTAPPVPWIKHPDRPARTPPGGAGARPPNGASAPRLEPGRPILTPDELDALTSNPESSDELPGRGEP